MPKHFILHAASLDQAFAHCRIFSAAATRRCMDRHSGFSDHSEYQTIPSPEIILVESYFGANMLATALALNCVAITPSFSYEESLRG